MSEVSGFRRFAECKCIYVCSSHLQSANVYKIALAKGHHHMGGRRGVSNSVPVDLSLTGGAPIEVIESSPRRPMICILLDSPHEHRDAESSPRRLMLCILLDSPPRIHTVSDVGAPRV